MLTGYARVSKADGSQSLDLQRDALLAGGVDEANPLPRLRLRPPRRPAGARLESSTASAATGNTSCQGRGQKARRSVNGTPATSPASCSARSHDAR